MAEGHRIRARLAPGEQAKESATATEAVLLLMQMPSLTEPSCVALLLLRARAHFRVFGRGAPSSGPPALAHVRGPNSISAPWAAPKTGQGARSITTIGLAKFRTCSDMCWFFLPDP